MAVFRRIDELGRITIPKIIRQNLNLSAGTQLSISEENGGIVLKKDGPCCALCGGDKGLISFGKNYACSDCVEKFKQL